MNYWNRRQPGIYTYTCRVMDEQYWVKKMRERGIKPTKLTYL